MRFVFPRYLNNRRFHYQHIELVKPQGTAYYLPCALQRGEHPAQVRVWQCKASLRSAQEQRRSCGEKGTEGLRIHISWANCSTAQPFPQGKGDFFPSIMCRGDEKGREDVPRTRRNENWLLLLKLSLKLQKNSRCRQGKVILWIITTIISVLFCPGGYVAVPVWEESCKTHPRQ